ncbi:acyl-CoA dehydrogenase [Rhizobium sp. L1K21]|uniref:acyl-CoA dehydrogenase n=1 Tax=Rhizobium sp. L1K21 TaxID=2954933 RepID=UPI002091E76E|nr:acyl-CoA dehydrogenase [Rhizobium sp. L1K21]MCO6186505.1 acyl-CoA dehydrogenase [Rhizobium sp. L1K21]
MSAIVDRRNIDFMLYEFLELEPLFKTPRYAAHDRQTVAAMLDSAEAIAEKYFQPIAAALDQNEPKAVNGKVEIIDGVKQALDAFAEAGFFAAVFDEADGGLQLPFAVNLLAGGIFQTANQPIANYAFLTQGNANMMRAFGSEEQIAKYMPPMLEGRWYGTMCLSEPQAGSSLSDITCKAEPLGDGTYRISGAKMWISGGDQELSENIVHMVLAKIPGGAPGVKGISLFLVPKYRVNNDGSLGEFNNIGLGGLNHKMGQRGTTNCLLNFSDGGDTIGTLVGEEGQGIFAMFHMMNEARIGVGHTAVMAGLGGYLFSLNYARERLQGRHPQDKDPTAPQVPIIEHADIRRMLLAQKAAVEGGLALTTFCAYLTDLQKVETDEETRGGITMLLEILTPIAKSWPSEHCLEANKLAIQVLGGYGYTREFPVERYYRDNRLNPIHEGTYGIQGLDLLGRKVRMKGGLALKILIGEMSKTLKEAQEVALTQEAEALKSALSAMTSATETVLACEDANKGLANATLYLNSFGHVVIAWLWLKQAIAASKAIAAGKAVGDDETFYKGKLGAFRYFYRYELPKVHAEFALVQSLDDTCLNFAPDDFGAV